MTIDVLGIIALFGIPSAVTGICFWYLKKYIDHKEARQEEARNAQRKNEILIIQSTQAAIGLSEAVAIAMKHGKTNGETEKAVDYAQSVVAEQHRFLTEEGILNILKED